MRKKLLVFGGIILAIVAIFWVFRYSAFGTDMIWHISDGGKALLPLVVIASFIDSINPCAFSILLLTIAFLFSIGKLRSRVMGIGLSYIFGIFVVYILIGLGIFGTLHLFDTPHFMAKIGALLLVVLGILQIAQEFIPRFPISFSIPASAHQKMAAFMERASIPAAFALGGLVGLCEFPCTGGPYLMVLGLLHDAGTYLKGLAYLVLYNLIFIAPLVVMLVFASDRTLLDKVQEWRRSNLHQMRRWSGIAMVVLGSIIFFL